MFKEDILTLENEPPTPNSEALLTQIMKDGELTLTLPKLDDIQKFYLENIKKLPASYKKLEEADIFRLKVSEKLQNLTDSLKRKYP
jgi:hypothetical protein